MAEDFVNGSLHPKDLKNSLAAAINLLIEPVRHHFSTDPVAMKLLEQVRKFRVTR